MAIQSFSDSEAEKFFLTGKIGKKVKWKSLASIVQRKLDILNYAFRLEDLRSPPGNRLEALRKDLEGFYSIRINDQWRIVFAWSNQGPTQVRIVDYH